MDFVIACHFEKVPTITCPQGTAIKVLYANYGRTTPSVKICPFKHATKDDTGCYANGDKVAAVCEGKQTCTVVPGNLGLGDPCKGTYKYTEVRYTCKPRGTLLRLV